jgi:hypothetical protein
MLEGAAHVEFHVSFSCAGSDRGGGDRVAARPDQQMKGGSPNRSQKLMRLRVLLQFVAIIVIMATIWVLGR